MKQQVASVPPFREVVLSKGGYNPAVAVMAIVNMLLIIISVVQILAGPEGGDGWPQRISLVYLLWLLVFIGGIYAYHRTVYLYSVVYVACLSIFHFGIVFQASLGTILLPRDWVSGPFSSFLEEAGWLILTALASFGLGFSSSALFTKHKVVSGSYAQAKKRHTYRVANWMSIGLLLSCVVFALLAFKSYGNLLAYSRAEIFRSASDSRGLGVFMMIFPGAVCLFFLSARTRWSKIMGWGLTVFALLLFLFSGYRSAALFTAFVGVVTWVKQGRKLPIWVAAAMLFSAAIFISFFGVLRTTGAYQDIDSEDIKQSFENASVEQSLLSIGNTVSIVAHVVELVPEADPYRQGQSYWIALKSSIPNIGLNLNRSLGRGSIRSSASLDDSAARNLAPGDWLTYRILRNQFYLNQGVGFSGVAEPYLNFGLPGVILFFITLGLMLGILDSKNISLSPKLMIFCCAMLWPLMRTVRNDFANFIKPLIFISIVLIIWWVVSRFFLKKDINLN